MAAAHPLVGLALASPGRVAARGARPLGGARLRQPARPAPGDLGRGPGRADAATCPPTTCSPTWTGRSAASSRPTGVRRRQPRQWLHAYAGATSRSGRRCSRSGGGTPLPGPRGQRVGAAAVRGRLDVRPGRHSPGGPVRGRGAEDPRPGPAGFDLGGRRLVLVPMVSGGDALMCSLDRPDAVWLGYPVPGAGRPVRRRPPGRERHALELLLGPVRAQVLAALIPPDHDGRTGRHDRAHAQRDHVPLRTAHRRRARTARAAGPRGPRELHPRAERLTEFSKSNRWRTAHFTCYQDM